MMNNIRKVLLTWQMRRRIKRATEAIYSEQFDLDALARNIAGSNESVDLLRSYIAIRVAADIKLRVESQVDDVLEEACSSELDLHNPDLRDVVLELHKTKAETSLLKAKIEFAQDRLAPEFSYRGTVYLAEKNKKGPLSREERDRFRIMVDKLAEAERELGSSS